MRLFFSTVCVSSLVFAASTSFAANSAATSIHEQTSPHVAPSHASYHYAPAAGSSSAWSALNRSQGIQSTISPTGIELTPLDTSDEPGALAWTLTLRTSAFGRESHSAALTAATVSARDTRVELDHGPLVEWFENDERGVEQGWTIANAPRGNGPLWIGLTFGGDLSLRLDDGGRSGRLVDARGGIRARYVGLVAFDASGRDLDARLTSTPNGVGIRVDDAGALYPLTVDPVLTGAAWTQEGQQSNGAFGFAVAPAGDVNGDGFGDIIVGAPDHDAGQSNEGRAYVYYGSASGLLLTPAWTAEGNQINARFGTAVATAGDVNGDGFSDVIVGAPEYDNGQLNEGRTYVYLGSAIGLATTAAWIVESNQQQSRFGAAASAGGDLNGDGFGDVLVGAPGHDGAFTDMGRVSVYYGSASGLATTAGWTADGEHTGASFGRALSLAGDVDADGYGDVIIGCASTTGSGAGRARVYHGSATGLGAAAAWAADSTQFLSNFGVSVSTAGDVNGDGYSDVIVGEPLYTTGAGAIGAAYVFMGSAQGLALTPSVTKTGLANSGYGGAVSTAGDVNGDGFADVIVGSSYYSVFPAATEGGLAQVYTGSAAGTLTIGWVEYGAQAGARLGFAVATAGDVDGDGLSDVIVSAPEHSNGETEEGRVFVHHGYRGLMSTLNSFAEYGVQANLDLGRSVASAGDVDGDGFGDVIVGSPGFTSGETDEGRAEVYLGSALGLATTAAWSTESDQAGAAFGFSVASAGDIDGDGFGDVIVGVPGYDGGQPDEGRAYVYRGSASGLSAIPTWTVGSNQAGARFGESVASAGDVNGDGYGDVIVGAPFHDGAQPADGRVFVYHGSPGGLSTGPTWLANGSPVSQSLGEAFGSCVSSAGDVNRDGYSDVIVGAKLLSSGVAQIGSARLYFGSPNGLLPTPAWATYGTQAQGFFGTSVSGAGDVNGDGFSDVVVGASGHSDGQTGEGIAYLFLGSNGGLSVVPAWTAQGDRAQGAFGTSVACAGDLNGDGLSDVTVGAPGGSEGEVAYFLGIATGLAPTSAITFLGDGEYGHSVAGAGDIDGDGLADVLIGAPDYTGSLASQGLVVAIVELFAEPRTSNLRQLRGNGSTPIAPLGATGPDQLLQLTAGLPSAFGRTAMQPEYEVKPLGTSFDGTATTLDVPVDIGSQAAVDALRTFSGLPSGALVHWRVRARYDPVRSPLLRNGPWMHPPTNGWNEGDLRVRWSGTTTELFCFGDSSSTVCPCLNSSAPGAEIGCLNSLGLGGKLRGSGEASVAADTFVLSGSQMPSNSALYFQGTTRQGGGFGTTFGDGLRCAGGSIIRLITKNNVAGSSVYPAIGELPISTRGSVLAPGTRTYQIWYRNPASFCTSSPFNLTNGLSVTWSN